MTRDIFGALATNLALLLEKDAADSYPWWGPTEFRKYLEQRIVLHGKVFSDDELDYAGYFIRHGSFDSAIKTHADLATAQSGVLKPL